MLLIGAALLVRRDRDPQRQVKLEPAATESASESAADVSPAESPVLSSAAGIVRSDECRTLDREVVDTIERDGRVALDSAEARARLLLSPDPEHLATAALFARGAADRVADITRAMAMGRRNATVVWTAVQVCVAADAGVACPSREWEATLLELDGENSEVWIQLAETRWQRGEIAAALEATQRAAAAAETRTYWADTVEMIERALASTGGYSFPTRVVAASGFAAGSVPIGSARLNMCRTQSQESPVWAEACLSYGRLAERRTGSYYGEVIGQSLQIAALEASGRDASDVVARRELARRERNEVANHAGEVFITTPAQFFGWLATLRERGERSAQSFLLEQAGLYKRCGGER